MNKKLLVNFFIFILIIMSLSHTTLSYEINNPNYKSLITNYYTDKNPHNKILKYFSADENTNIIEYQIDENLLNKEKRICEENHHFKSKNQIARTHLDSAWPMFCFDAQHTGRSPYNTASNPGYEKWFFKTDNFIEGSAAIDDKGVIYFGSWMHGEENFYALYPNGTLKWKYEISGCVDSTGPAIDKNGIIYIGTARNGNGDNIFAFYPNGTLKWKFKTNEDIYGSPVIGNNGMIFFSTSDGYPWFGHIYSLYPNGSLKWKYKTSDVIRSDPAIGVDGAVYCGCHNGKLYVLNPNNGTLKWSYNTGGEVSAGISLSDDGTVYFCSWDGHTRALYPNGTLKWTSSFGRTTPVIGPDGTIYVGSEYLTAINPDDGSIKWSNDIPGDITAGNPCISADGIIYCGTNNPGYIVALNPDGTERWKKYIGECKFAPIIGEDGTVYIGTSVLEEIKPGAYNTVGYLYAFNEKDVNAPSTPVITGRKEPPSKTPITYGFLSISPLGNDVYYYIDWGDGDWRIDYWLGPFDSGKIAFINHSWSKPGDYTIRCRCKDSDNLWSDWSEYKVSVPRNRLYFKANWLILTDMFPIIQRILSFIK